VVILGLAQESVPGGRERDAVAVRAISILRFFAPQFVTRGEGVCPVHDLVVSGGVVRNDQE